MAKVYVVCSGKTKAFNEEGPEWTDCLIEDVFAFEHMAEAKAKYYMEQRIFREEISYWVEQYEIQDAF